MCVLTAHQQAVPRNTILKLDQLITLQGSLSIQQKESPTSLTFFKNKDFMYLFMRDTERERERQRHRHGEKQAPCWEPDVGLHPGTPGLQPGPKGWRQTAEPPRGPPHISHFKSKSKDARLGQSVEHAILDLRVISLSPTLGLELT